MMDIIEEVPLIHDGMSWIHWNNSTGILINVEVFLLFQPKCPKVGWFSLFLGLFRIPRNLFILWLAILERLSTLDKPWCMIDNQECMLCDTHVMETHNHLFFACPYAQQCLTIIRRQVRFQWPYDDWQMGIQWASRRWRGRYVVNATYRATIASLVYHLWRERNLRRFQNIRVEAEIVATLVMEQIRHRILSDESGFNLKTRFYIDYGIFHRVCS
ncbi:UNVERIFIED_CONTAM: hypothetical protein Scaly_1072400 [Sesamum calycinum]|uniref:Reverse transcriptase zinc-binding domain-containing protein n=1 Tax=Sesamum calycinum TaxID=2727403 RepID=A0AAW2QLB9_9LAMI